MGRKEPLPRGLRIPTALLVEPPQADSTNPHHCPPTLTSVPQERKRWGLERVGDGWRQKNGGLPLVYKTPLPGLNLNPLSRGYRRGRGRIVDRQAPDLL